MALSVLIWFTAWRYPAGIFTLFFYTIEIYKIVSFWYNCVLWTVQINWKRRVNKPKNKTNNTICVGHLHTKTNTNNENKIILCPFFFSTLTYLSLFDLQLHAIPLASFTCCFFYTIEIYMIVSFWYNCVLWTVQINWKHMVNKPKKKTNNNTICVGHHHKKTNTNNENKIIICPFFFSTLTYLSLFDLRLHATPLVSFTLFFYTIQI